MSDPFSPFNKFQCNTDHSEHFHAPHPLFCNLEPINPPCPNNNHGINIFVSENNDTNSNIDRFQTSAIASLTTKMVGVLEQIVSISAQLANVSLNQQQVEMAVLNLVSSSFSDADVSDTSISGLIISNVARSNQIEEVVKENVLDFLSGNQQVETVIVNVVNSVVSGDFGDLFSKITELNNSLI